MLYPGLANHPGHAIAVQQQSGSYAEECYVDETGDEYQKTKADRMFGGMLSVRVKGGGAVAKDVAGKQIHSSVNNPSEALGFYESGDMVPLVAFTNERLPMFPEVPTLKEKGSQFTYYMQRSVVGAPGMSADASAYYSDLFTKVYKSVDWQTYKSKKSLMGDFMSGTELMAYWKVQRGLHEKILKASGAIK